MVGDDDAVAAYAQFPRGLHQRNQTQNIKDSRGSTQSSETKGGLLNRK